MYDLIPISEMFPRSILNDLKNNKLSFISVVHYKMFFYKYVTFKYVLLYMYMYVYF